MTKRSETRRINIGDVPIGGGAPVAVQSMTNTPTHDAEKTLAQVEKLAAAGCEVVRVAVPDRRAAKALPELVNGASIPLVADIHFSEQLALASVEAGVAGLRLNPGNLRDPGAIRRGAQAGGEGGGPLRVR